MSDKFKELMEQFEAAGVELKKEVSAQKEMVPSTFITALGETVDADGKKKSLSQVVSENPSELEKVKEINAASKIIMPPVPFEEWLVQVYPDDGQVLHFQAKSAEYVPYYQRWYEKVDGDVYDAVKAVYDAAQPSQFRFSMYGSSKQYLICKRMGNTTVEVPGYGEFDLPDLFG